MDFEFVTDVVKVTPHHHGRQVNVEIEGAELEDVLVNVTADDVVACVDNGDLLDHMNIREIVDHHDATDILDVIGAEVVREWLNA